MAPILYLGHGALAVGAAAVYLVTPGALRTTRTIAVLGGALGVITVLAAGDVGPWRTTEPSDAAGAIAGATAVALWLIVAVRPTGGPRVAIGAGVGASALALFATSIWVVPALLFLVCAALAAGALAALGARPALPWFAIATGACALVGALGLTAYDGATWRVLAPEGLYLWLGYGAALALVGVLPLLIWQAAGPGSAAIPLVVGIGFVALTKIGGQPEPGLAAGLLLLALALAVGSWVARMAMAAIGAWVSATFAAVALAAPETVAIAGIAAVVAGAAVALWPFARGRGRFSRGLILSFGPPTVAFGAIVAAEAHAFTRATTDASGEVAWSALAALLPLVVAAGVILGCGAARTAESDDFDPSAVLATWALLGASIVTGAFLHGAIEVPAIVARTSLSVLYPVALVAGIGVAVRIPSQGAPPGPAEVTVPVGALDLSSWLNQIVIVVSSVVAVGGLVGAGWLTYQGLSVGFL